MSRRPFASVLLLSALASGVAQARPYPLGTGMAASADSDQTAGSNPAGISDDLGDWPGRYFIESYDSVFVSAFPSVAYRIDDQWSVAASAAVTYSSFEQQRAVRNILDPGFGDGRSRLEADNELSGLGPNTERAMQRLGVLDADLRSRAPHPNRSRYHEFNNAAVTADLAWINFSDFRLSEFYYNGQSFVPSRRVQRYRWRQLDAGLDLSPTR